MISSQKNTEERFLKSTPLLSSFRLVQFLEFVELISTYSTCQRAT